VLRTLTSRRWLGALAVAAAFAVAAWFLGQWQWGRYEDKSARADRINSHYRAAPQPLADVLTTSPLPRSTEWTRVTARGTYAADDTLLVRNRPNDGIYGYEVLVPFRTDGGMTVLVDRGWVRNAEAANELPAVTPAPSGEVTMTGWVRPSEKNLERRMPAGQLASINVQQASAQLGESLLGGYVIMEVERTATGQSPPRPDRLEPPDTDLGPHQAYAFQWWLAMVAGFVLVVWGARREHLEDLESPDAAPRPKKVRIWDEEDE